MKVREEYTCPVEVMHDIMKGKWKTIILFQLKYGPQSLSQLQHQIAGISQKMLLEQLKELMMFGLVDKRVYEGYPLHVEYFYTEGRGRKMMEVIELMQQIGIDYLLEHGQEEVLREKGIIH